MMFLNVDNDEVNKRGFAPVIVIGIIAIVFVLVFLASRKTNTSQTDSLDSPISEDVGSVPPQTDTVSSELTDITCENIQATFKAPSGFVKYEETNQQGEQVCLLSDKIQDGHVSPTRIYIMAIATQRSSDALGMTSRKAAMADTQKYGGLTDLPEAVVKKGKFATYHVIAPDSLKNTATWYIDSVSNDDTDSYYTISLSVPKTLSKQINSQEIMNGYSLSEAF